MYRGFEPYCTRPCCAGASVGLLAALSERNIWAATTSREYPELGNGLLVCARSCARALISTSMPATRRVARSSGPPRPCPGLNLGPRRDQKGAPEPGIFEHSSPAGARPHMPRALRSGEHLPQALLRRQAPPPEVSELQGCVTTPGFTAQFFD